MHIVISAFCYVVALIALCMPRRSEDSGILNIMWMLYSFLSLYMPKFVYCIFSFIGRLCNRNRKQKRNFGAIIGVIIGIVAFVLMWWGVISTRYDIVVNNVTIEAEKLPKSFDGFKVVQFSDAHVGTWGNDTTFVSALVDSINAQNGDLVLFTGDIVNRRSSELEPFINAFKRLKAKQGVYAILGNHDYAGYVDWRNPADANKDVERLCDIIENRIGWTLLKNQTAFIKSGNDSIVLIGVENWGEPPFGQLGDLGKSYPNSADNLHGLNDGMFKILLTHNPEHWVQVATKISNVDLTLSGHTHAMQCMFELGDWKWSPCCLKYKTWGGLYSDSANDGNIMNIYVNIGCGEVGFPARIGAAKPEVTNFTLTCSK